MLTKDLIKTLNTWLEVHKFKDYCPNGLQVEGKNEVKTVITAVSASNAAIDFAIKQNADALLVHHGYFWRGESPEVVGIKKNRLKKLLENEINLIAYHLPLDAHLEFGNNRLLGEFLGFSNFRQSETEPLVWLGESQQPQEFEAFKTFLEQNFNQQIAAVKAKNEMQKFAWCSGAAQDFLTLAKEEGADCFITGEFSERTFYEAKELGINFFGYGHYLTETFGVQRLGLELKNKLALEVMDFIEKNPF